MSAELIMLLFLGGVALLMCELVAPHAFMGILGVSAMVVAIVQAFQKSAPLGLVLTAIAVVGAPLVVYYGLKRLQLKRSLGEKEGCVSAGEDLSSLVNEEGVALTPLHPTGTVRVSGKRVDVITEGEMIDAGGRVRVVKVEGAKVVVKRA